MSGTTIYTDKYYTVVGTDYCWIYGCADYKVTDNTTYVRVMSDWVGEAWTEGPGTYTETASATLKVTVNGTTCTTGSLSSSRTCTVSPGSYTYVKAGGSSSNYVDIQKGESSKKINLVLTYTIRGTSYTKTVPITIPALKSYSVSYKANSGSGSMSASTKWYGKTLTLKANAFTKSGYTFQGWATSASGSVAYSNKGSYTANADATLYAQWKKDITVTYNANTGTGAPSSQTKSVWNSTTSASFTLSSTIPTKSNYKFVKWNTKADGSGTDYKPGTSYTFSSSVTLYAQWTADYIAPRYKNIDAHRTNADGTENSGAGSYGYLHFTWTSGSISGTSLNTVATAKYRAHGTTAWTNITNSSSTANTFTAIFGGDLASDTQYDILLSLKDSGQTAVTRTTFISTEAFAMDINADGTAIGFFRSAPDNKKGIFVNGSVAVDGHDSPIGDFKSATLEASVTVASSTPKAINSIALDKGVWVITANVRFPAMGTTSATVYANISPTEADTALQYRAPSEDSIVAIQLTYIAISTANAKPFYLNVYHSSGSNKSFSTANTLRAVRIA